MTVLSSPTVKLNTKAKVLLGLVIAAFVIPVLVFGYMAVQGFVGQSGDKEPLDVVATGVSHSQAIISWATMGKVSGTIEYGTTPNALQTYAPEVVPAKEHEVELTLLTPATTYYYHIRINGKVYDNDGVPFTFTTKTTNGEEVARAIKGVSTKLSVAPSATPRPQLGTSSCDETECSKIKSKLGKGCSASDYFKCINTPQNSEGNLISPTPSPTPISFFSNSCAMKYLQVQPGKNCTEWTWDPYAIKIPKCKDAFHQYVFQCSSKDFNSTNTSDIAIWYYNNAITNMATNTITLNSMPNEGSVVYCQVRAEDEMGNATPWIQESVTCTYTPTPTPTAP